MSADHTKAALYSRLGAIGRRELDDRTISSGEALDLVELWAAARSVHAGLTCAQDPMDVDERIAHLGDVLKGLNG